MDHTHDAALICQVWSAALPAEPEAWDDGVCGPLVAQLLFGVRDHPMADVDPNPLWKAQLMIRGGNKRGVKGQRAFQFCHDVRTPTTHIRSRSRTCASALRPGTKPTKTTTNDTNDTEDDTEVDDDATEVDDDDETLPPDEEELAEALVDVAPTAAPAAVVDLTVEEGASVDHPIEL